MITPKTVFPTARYGADTYILLMVYPSVHFITYSTPPVRQKTPCLRTYKCFLILTMATNDMQRIVRNILRDIRVDLTDEFDKNFERQAFFSEAWTRRRSPVRSGGATLVHTGQLRRSIKSKSTESSITFHSDLPYAGIHNDGGEIKVTAKMKRFFWAKYYEATGAFGRKKNGERRNDKRTIRLSTEAEFWKLMALMKVGKSIVIPRRRFIGQSPEVEKLVSEIIEENLIDYFNHEFELK